MRYRIAPHLAFMVQWLRVLGFDVDLWKKGEILDPLQESLIQWKRYPIVSKGKDQGVVTLSASSLPQLLREFLEKCGQKAELGAMFGRCLHCNTPLISLTPDEAKACWPDLPEYVYRTQKRFNRCGSCGKLFWEGTHVRNMLRTLRDWEVLPDEGEEGG